MTGIDAMRGRWRRSAFSAMARRIAGRGRRGRGGRLPPPATRPALLASVVIVPALAGSFLVRDDGAMLRIEESTSRELVLEFGPFDLPAGAGHHEVAQPAPGVVPVPAAGWVRGYGIEILDGEGRAVPPAVVHHVNLITPDRRELFSEIMLRIGAAGHETGEVRLPSFLGHPVESGQEIMVAAMLHNPTAASYRGVRLRIHMPFTPQRRWVRPIAIYPVYLDVMPPASRHAYDMPPGRSEQSWEGSPAVPGRLLGVGGHLHRYGVRLRLEDVTRDRTLWEARPVVDETGAVVAMPTRRWLWRLGLPLRPDRTYRLTAVYDNPTGELIPLGAMGALGGIFRPARGHAWPEADPEHWEYRLDVQLVTEGGYDDDHDHGAAGAGHHHH